MLPRVNHSGTGRMGDASIISCQRSAKPGFGIRDLGFGKRTSVLLDSGQASFLYSVYQQKTEYIPFPLPEPQISLNIILPTCD